MAVRKAEVEYVGNASSMVLASRQAAAAGDLVASSARKAGKAIAEQAALASKAAEEQARVAGASAAQQAAAAARAADAATAAGIRQRAALEDTAAATARASKTASKMGRDFALGAFVAAAGAADMALKVEHAAGRIAASSGTSVDAAKRIEGAFQTTAGSAIWSADQIGEAYAKVAGELGTVEGHALKQSEAMKVMTAAQNLAEASGGELDSTTEALGKTMLVYHLGASKAAEASDVLFAASKKTGTSVEETGFAIDRIKGRLGVLAPSLRESGGLMSDLARHGIQGRESLAALNGVFNTLVGGGKKVEAMTKELGVRVFDSEGKFVGLKNVIAQLGPALSRYDEQSQLAAAKVLFGASANKKLLDIIHEGPTAFQAATDAVAKHGSAAQSAERHSETFAGELEKLKTALKDEGGVIGGALIPELKALVGATGDSAKWLGKHETAAKALAGVIATVLGGALTVFAYTKAKKFIGATEDMITAIGVLGKKIGIAAGEVETADGAIVTANASAAGSFKALAGATGIGLAIGAVYELDKALEGLEKKLGGGLGDALNQFINKVTSGFVGASPGVEFGKKFAEAVGIGEKPGSSKPGPSGGIAGGLPFTGNPLAAGLGPGGTGKSQAAFLESLGIARMAAAGLAGNFQNEGKPGDTGKEGLGIGQWTGARRAALEAFAKAMGVAATNETVQLEFAARELKGSYGSVLAAASHAKSAREAAAILMKGYEKPKEGPEAHQDRREQSAAEAYGTGHLPSIELAARHRKAKGKVDHGPSPAAIDHWAETAVGKLAETWGKNTGPELDKLQSEFHTHAAAWCAEFATTAAMMGGANKAVRTASVAMIRQWAEQGSHGYQKGVSHTPQVGSLMMFGDSHVGFVQSVDKQAGTDVVIEGNANGSGGVVRRTRRTSEGDYATPIYHKITTGKVMLEQASKAYAEAVKKAEHLFLTAGEKLALHRLSGAAAGAHSQVEQWKNAASEAGEALQAYQPRWALKRQPLDTAQGAHEQTLDDEQAIETAKAQKKYYERAVRWLQKEVNELVKRRDFFLRVARHQRRNEAGPG